MDQIQREKALEKLGKIKALAERGVGGEKETALRMYKELMEKYDISEEEAEMAITDIEQRWFSYRTQPEKRLLSQIFYKVTRDANHFEYKGKYKRRKKVAVNCTEIEALEIQLLFDFYREELEKEISVTVEAFIMRNHLYPDKTARVHFEFPERIGERSEEEKRMRKKAFFRSQGMDMKKPPRAEIEDKGGGE